MSEPHRMRVVDNLNRGLHRLFEQHPDAVLLGEDVIDPYGGAFRVTKGLSQRFPGRVRSTPISESALTGVATGLALAGRTVLAEIMFSDFATLAFDLLVNFAAKLPTMYGTRLDIRLIVRTATGAGRGYGATHSQSLQKHFIGVPGLSLFEMTPFHDAGDLFDAMLATGQPCLLFEDKVLYTRWTTTQGRVGSIFTLSHVGPAPGIARLAMDSGAPDCLLISTGGTAERTVEAARRLFLEQEIGCEVLVPALLHPLDAGSLDTITRAASLAGRVFVIEESTAGGTWGADLALELNRRLWRELRGPVDVICSAAAVIPAAPHLEREVIVQTGEIVARVAAACSAAHRPSAALAVPASVVPASVVSERSR
jgi:pyruvate/2-oxoglutarate/acetoin dehydrogenase E1 component